MPHSLPKPSWKNRTLLKILKVAAMLALLALVLHFTSTALAARFTLTAQEIDDALALGRAQAADPAKLFEPYSFGKLGVETNGYLLTKTLELSLLAASDPKLTAADKRVKEIVEKDHVVMPVYLIHTDKNAFAKAEISLRQGVKTLPAAKILRDEPKKAHCQGESCVYTCDIFPGFFYKDLEPGLMLVLVVTFAGESKEFRIPFGNLK